MILGEILYDRDILIHAMRESYLQFGASPVGYYIEGGPGVQDFLERNDFVKRGVSAWGAHWEHSCGLTIRVVYDHNEFNFVARSIAENEPQNDAVYEKYSNVYWNETWENL